MPKNIYMYIIVDENRKEHQVQSAVLCCLFQQFSHIIFFFFLWVGVVCMCVHACAESSGLFFDLWILLLFIKRCPLSARVIHPHTQDAKKLTQNAHKCGKRKRIEGKKREFSKMQTKKQESNQTLGVVLAGCWEKSTIEGKISPHRKNENL